MPHSSSMQRSASGRRWAIATPHEAASEAAAQAFERGGNAIDAALAAATTLAVVYPAMCGVGGDLFALVQRPEGDVVAINSSGAAPAEIRPDEVRAKHGDRMPERGPLTVIAPGAAAGWRALHDHGADLPWAEIFDRATALASDGVPLAPFMASVLRESAELLAPDPGFREVFFRGGEPLHEGEVLEQPALAKTLEALALGGAEALYRGTVGAAYVAGLRAAGSPLGETDLAAHAAEVLPPLMGRYGDLDMRVAPPTSQGFVLLEALLATERLGLDPDPFGPDAGVLALVFRAASADRDRHLADPRAMRVHPSTLLDDGHVAALCDEVRDGWPERIVPGAPLGRDTVGLVTADAAGFAVSLIQSLSFGFGSGILEPQTGIVAQNRGSGFSLDPEHPNVLEPGKRPAHTLMPVMAHRGGRLAAVSGTMGGPAHPQINAMSLHRALGLGMSPADAVAAPRWIEGGMDDREDVVEAESGVPAETIALLERAGFRTERLGALDPSAGHAHLIRARADGLLEAGADPRADGSALAD